MFASSKAPSTAAHSRTPSSASTMPGVPFIALRRSTAFFIAVVVRRTPPSEGYLDGLYREFLADGRNTYFADGDLNPSNLMVVGEPGSSRIRGIIDWEQAGRYPEYWKYCKLLISVPYDHEWREAGWVSKVTRNFENEWWAYSQYSMWRNPQPLIFRSLSENAELNFKETVWCL